MKNVFTYSIYPYGDCALSITFPNEISPDINARVHALVKAVDDAHLPGIVGCTPAYCTLLVEYDPLVLDYAQARSAIQALGMPHYSGHKGNIISLPVCYGGDFGPDIHDVAAHAGISESEVAAIHSDSSYHVYMMGFLPGFPYVGGLDERLHTPRRPAPRLKVTAGSVGIAGGQTGVYPQESPGGWQIIGRTPLKLYDPETACSLIHPGDTLRFVQVSMEKYQQILETGVWGH